MEKNHPKTSHNVKKTLLKLSFFALLLISLLCQGSTKPKIEFEITGIRGDPLNNVIEKLQKKAKTIDRTNLEEINKFYLEVPEEIARTLKLYGYFNPKITSEKPFYEKNFWRGDFNIDPGPPMIITSIDLKTLGSGSSDRKISYNLRKFPLKKGDIFQAEEYNTAKQFLFDLTDKYGYIAASFATKEIQINTDNNTAKIILHFNTGPRYYFGKTTFNAPYFSESFLRRFLTYRQKERYSNKKLHQLREALSNSNFFQTIKVKPKISKAKDNLHKVPIEINLTRKKLRRYSFGAGFSTDMGVRGSLETEFRYLTKTGQSFKGLIQGSQVQNNLELHYLIPGKNPYTDLYNISVAGETINIEQGKSFNIQTGVGYRTSLKNWQQTIKLNLQHERYKLGNLPYQDSTLLIPGINIMQIKKDNMAKPNKGHRVNLILQGTTKYISSSSDFLQVELDAKYLYTFDITQSQIILHGIFGYTFIDKLNDLPLSLQFYAGGTQTIRGFGYNTIGPGRNIAVGSIELRQKLYGDLYFATFYDAGNVSEDLFKKPRQSAGIGLVYRTSIGTLELTYGKAISEPGTPGRVQFTMGPDL